MTARRPPTFEEKLQLITMIAAKLRGAPEKPKIPIRDLLPKWYTRKEGDEGLYAEPPLDLGALYEDAAAGSIKSLTQKAYDIADSGKYTIKQLRVLQKDAADKSAGLAKKKQWQESMDEASESQKWREAAERMEGQPQHFKKAEYISNPAIRIKGQVIEGDYAKGGHVEIVNKIDRDPRLKAAFDRGEYIEGGVTDAGTFVGKRPDVDFSEIKGRDVKEIGEFLIHGQD